MIISLYTNALKSKTYKINGFNSWGLLLTVFIRNALAATTKSKYGSGNGHFLMTSVTCSGTETSLNECEHLRANGHCNFYGVAGVECNPNKISTGGGNQLFTVSMVTGGGNQLFTVSMVTGGGYHL